MKTASYLINGNIVTAEEWDAARTQAIGLPDSVMQAIAAGAIKRAKRKEELR